MKYLPFVRTRLIVLGCLSLLVYSGIAWLSQSFIYGQGHHQRPIFSFLALYASAFVLYIFALHCWMPAVRTAGQASSGTPSAFSSRRGDLTIALGFAILFRVILLFSNPIQEDDFYRYLWDGKVAASGLNPYGITPAAVEEHKEGTQEYGKIIEHDNAFAMILARVNHPWVPTIYPPLAQGIFALTALVAPGSLLGLRLTFLTFDLGVCLLIIVLLRVLEMNAAWVLVYAWSPLVVKETINSAHYDIVPTFFLVLAVLLMLRGRGLWAQVSLALATLGKLYPVLLAPLFLLRIKASHGWRRAVYAMLLMIAVILVGYAPFLSAGAGLWQGTVTFAEGWQTNSFLFPLLRVLVGNRWLANGITAVALVGLLLILLCRVNLQDDHSFPWSIFVMLGGLFLLSPVGNPWYFLWLAPFLCVFPRPSWIVLSGLLGLYYLSFYFMYHKAAETFRWVLWLEYVPFYGMLIYEWRRARSKHESSSPAKSTLCPPL